MGAGVLMPNHLVRRSLVAGLASLSVAAIAGCGATGGAGGDRSAQVVASGVAPKAQDAAYLARAAETTGAVETLKLAITVSTTPADGDPSVSVTSTGEIDGAAGRAHLPADVAGTVSGRSDEASIEAVYDGDTVYVKAPFTQLLGDTPWVQVTTPKLAQLADRLGGDLQGDPGSFLELLEGAGGPVTTVGTEALRGVPTRHVAVGLDVEKVLAQAPADRRKALEDQLAERGIDLAKVGPIPAEAWIDDDGYVRKFSVSFDLAEVGKAKPGTDLTGVITQTVELYDFDQPVDIAIPPADQVTTLDLEKLLGDHGLGRGDGPGTSGTPGEGD